MSVSEFTSNRMIASILPFTFYFLLGTAVGSFLNVVSRRLLRGEPMGGRSHCESCGHLLGASDLIPLLSFVFLRGRCRYCGAKLAWQYPLVEGGTGLLFAALWLVSSQESLASSLPIHYSLFIIHYFSLLVASSSLIVVFITDFHKQRTFDVVVWVGVVSAFLYRLSFQPEGFNILNPSGLFLRIIPDLLLAAGVFAFFWLLRFLTKGRGMGDGDPPLGFLCALLVGFPLGVVMVFLSSVFGAVIGLIFIILGRMRFGEHIAFGPFLVAAVFVSLLFSGPILDWYLVILGF